MNEEIKHVQEIRLQVAHLVAKIEGMPPQKILDYAIPLSEWILGNTQKLPSNTENKE